MLWLYATFAAESIASATTMFVALLLFLQLGLAWPAATLLAASLLGVRIVKPLMARQHPSPCALCACLAMAEWGMALAMAALGVALVRGRGCMPVAAAMLMAVSLLCSWHETLSQVLYARCLSPSRQRYWRMAVYVCSMGAMVATYGLTLLGVGSLQVLHHQSAHAVTDAWGTAMLIVASLMALLALGSTASWLRTNTWPDVCSNQTLKVSSQRAGSRTVSASVLSLLLLLPQSLLFFSRVLFLWAPVAQGGLGCPLPWIGMAQGTIGVVAFAAGLYAGQWQTSHLGRRRWLSGRRAERRILMAMVAATAVSPAVYLVMTCHPPASLVLLCCATSVAQLSFGYSLNVVSMLWPGLSDAPLMSASRCLGRPAIAAAVAMPAALSGWAVQLLGFRHFFVADTLSALVTCVAAWTAWRAYTPKIQIQ